MEPPIIPSPSQPISLFSDDEDCCIAGGDENHSPWQRMRWTDASVRLLISLVAASIGDESDRKQSPALQRKGKWKLVSKSMTQKGCYVSPQQCEDKFNDLNKRYKRLNEILGRGTSCQVVENPALLDSMPHVPQKAKDDVRRILGSKHLFYREMCAYHNGQKIPDPKACGEAREVDVDDEEDDEEEDEEECFRNDDFCKMNRDKLRAEIDAVFRDSTKSQCERRVWIRKQLLQLQQERVGIQADAFELEKREMKWKRFCGKKDREFASLRMENERLRLENERMTLHVRHKEMEFDMARQGEMVELSCGQVEGERVRTQTGVGRLQGRRMEHALRNTTWKSFL